MVTFCRGKLIFVSVFARTIPQIKSRAIAWYVKIKIYGHFAVGFNRKSEYFNWIFFGSLVEFREFRRLIEHIIRSKFPENCSYLQIQIDFDRYQLIFRIFFQK